MTLVSFVFILSLALAWPWWPCMRMVSMSTMLKLPFYLPVILLVILAGWLLPLVFVQPKRVELPRW